MIGSSFNNGKGTITAISDVIKTKKGNEYIYEILCECSVCSMDKELYPEPFVTKLKAFKKEYYPCGCASRPLYSEDQYKKVISRMVNSTKHRYVGVSGEYLGSKTKAKCYCVDHNQEFETTFNYIQANIDKFGCKDCLKEFRRNRYIMTEEQATYRIVKSCLDSNYRFISMDEYTLAASTYFTYECSSGHIGRASYNNFVNNGHRCKQCSENGGGYNTDGSGWVYLVKWSNGIGDWLKVGITSKENPVNRFRDQSNAAKRNGSDIFFEVLFTKKFEDGNIPVVIEKELTYSKSGIISKDTMPDGYTECYPLSKYEDFKNFIDSYEVIE